MSGPKGTGNLSPRLAELAKPALRSASPARQAAALSLAPDGPGSLVRHGKRVLVEVRFERGAVAGAEGLRAAGAEVVGVSPRYQAVTAAARPEDLPTLAAVRGVAGVAPVLAPVMRGADCGGAVRSEGDGQLNAATARSAFGVDGSGVTVGILSDSFDRNAAATTHAGGDVSSGDLPGPGSPCGSTSPTNLLDDSEAGGTDEGRAMAQIVHDLAPGANLAFASATAANDQYAFAAAVRALRAAGASVLVDDVFFQDEPFFQDGPVAVAVNEVTAGGAAYFSAAGNDNVIVAGRDVGSWEGPFQTTGSCPAGTPERPTEGDEYECLDFSGGGDSGFGITVKGNGELELDLQWAEPWFGVGTDLDAYLVDSSDEVVASSEEDNPGETQRPFESLFWENPNATPQTVDLVVKRFAGSASPTVKLVMLENGLKDVTATEYPESTGSTTVGPTIVGHSGAAAAVAVGAVPFDDGSEPEYYSSRGPLTHYFGPVTGTSPAAALPSPQSIAKPDLVATDCGVTTFFAVLQAGKWRFCGTSAAAPHAAAVAALMRQANPSLSPGQLRSSLASTAAAVGAFSPNAVGAGLVDAYRAVSSVALAPAVSITERPPALGRNRRPSVGFTANRPVAFACSIDGGGLQPCSSPFVPTAPLTDGIHGFVVQGVDAAGRTGSSETVSFRIDTKRPRTFFRAHPHKTLRTHSRSARALFRFGSNEHGVTFVCKVDGGFQRFCKPRLVRRFRLGKHVLWVKARDEAGNVDRSAAVYRFQVKRAR